MVSVPDEVVKFLLDLLHVKRPTYDACRLVDDDLKVPLATIRNTRRQADLSVALGIHNRVVWERTY